MTATNHASAGQVLKHWGSRSTNAYVIARRDSYRVPLAQPQPSGNERGWVRWYAERTARAATVATVRDLRRIVDYLVDEALSVLEND